jgi:hypothetical protein
MKIESRKPNRPQEYKEQKNLNVEAKKVIYNSKPTS